MRVRRLDLTGAGPLGTRTVELHPRVSVFLGPNEAGKSTLAAILEAALYGIEADGPLAPFGEGLSLRAELTHDTGKEETIERSLPSANGMPLRVHKEELQAVTAIPRVLYRALWSLTPESLIQLEPDLRAHVDRLLCGAAAMRGLRSLHAVREELRRSAARLWRDDNRGKPRAAALRDELREARRQLGVARSRERELRAGRDELQRKESELEQLRKKRRSTEEQLADADYLRQLAELHDRREALVPLDLDGLSGESLIDPGPLARQVRALEERLGEPIARLRRKALELDDLEREHLKAAPRIDAAARTIGRHEAELEKLDELHAGARDAGATARKRLTRLTGRASEPEQLALLEQLPFDALYAAQEEWARAWENAAGAPSNTRVSVQPNAPDGLHWSIGASLLLGIAGASGLVAGVLLAWPEIALEAAATSLLLAWGLALRSPKPAETSALPTGTSPPDGALPAVVHERLTHFTLPADCLATPSALGRSLEALSSAAEAWSAVERRQERALNLARSVEEREESWAALAEELHIDAGGSGLEILARLKSALSGSQQSLERERSDRAERERARTLVDAHGAELESRRAHLRRIEAVLHTNLSEVADISLAYEELVERERGRQALIAMEENLRADSRWSRLARDPHVSGEEGQLAPWHPEALRARSQHLETIDSEIEELSRRMGEIDEQQRRDPGNGVARARERVLTLEEELSRICEARDRLMLIDGLVAAADRSWREEHEPDVLGRASTYLAQVTSAKWVALEQAQESGGALQVRPSRGARSLPLAPPLSRGLRDQVHLCLRLGLIDHLDADRESLPLVLDEALVNWDARRRKQLYSLLRHVTRRRQVLIMTCHAELAKEAAEALNTRVQTLNSYQRPSLHR